jgi:hypothetical protein
VQSQIHKLSPRPLKRFLCKATTCNTTHEVAAVPHEVAKVSHKAAVPSTRPLSIFKAFNRVPGPLKLFFFTSFFSLKCGVNRALAYRPFSRSKLIINFTLKRQRKVVFHNRIFSCWFSLVFLYGAVVAYIISAVCIPTPSSDINRPPVVDERISLHCIIGLKKLQQQKQRYLKTALSLLHGLVVPQNEHCYKIKLYP